MTIEKRLQNTSMMERTETREPDSPEKAGVLMTFDDGWNLSFWREHIPLFEKYGCRCTFFVNGSCNLEREDFQVMKELRDAGHEIGTHGANHVRAMEYIREKGLIAYLRDEIEPVHAVFLSNGFEATSFAYPMGSRTDASDRALMQYYRHVRSSQYLVSGKNLADSDLFFTPLDQVTTRFRLVGYGFDGTEETMLTEQIFPALDRLYEQREVLVLFSHRIARQAEKDFVKPDILERILTKTTEMGLEFYRFGDLPSSFPALTSHDEDRGRKSF